ncbi:hypothetical protein EVAR_57694_1 [Eumeta japonica]|uniref:Uncharacterized protein n=1 Tax=Eumeta variegata TaxID=151549 RepID=A0A4C1Y756_EUMVA|nr:hypothetical protein EVAR_57694_1 [Eumeta japonica]
MLFGREESRFPRVSRLSGLRRVRHYASTAVPAKSLTTVNVYSESNPLLRPRFVVAASAAAPLGHVGGVARYATRLIYGCGFSMSCKV